MEAGQSAYGDYYAWFQKIITEPVRTLLGEIAAEELSSRRRVQHNWDARSIWKSRTTRKSRSTARIRIRVVASNRLTRITIWHRPRSAQRYTPEELGGCTEPSQPHYQVWKRNFHDGRDRTKEDVEIRGRIELLWQLPGCCESVEVQITTRRFLHAAEVTMRMTGGYCHMHERSGNVCSSVI